MAARVRFNKASARKVLNASARRYGIKWAAAVKSDAKAGAPVDTGLMRSTVYGRRVAALTWRIGTSCGYGRYVEKGTRRMAAQPFLRPALYRRRAGV